MVKEYPGYWYAESETGGFLCRHCGKTHKAIYMAKWSGSIREKLDCNLWWLCPSCIKSLVEKGVLW